MNESLLNSNNAITDKLDKMISIIENQNKRLYNMENNLSTIGNTIISSHNRDNELIKSFVLSMQFFISDYLKSPSAEDSPSIQHSQKDNP